MTFQDMNRFSGLLQDLENVTVKFTDFLQRVTSMYTSF